RRRGRQPRHPAVDLDQRDGLARQRSAVDRIARPREHRDSSRAALRKARTLRLVEAVSVHAERTTEPVELDGRSLSLEALEAAAGGAPVRIGAQARKRVERARAFVEERFASGDAIYGVTTGFGRLANVPVAPADAGLLQLNLVRSHAAGTGPPLDVRLVRAAGVLRANSLSAGHSGVKLETLDLIVELLNRGVTPVVPCQGSVGASGDLAPLAHMSLTLIGEGEAFFQGERLPSAAALERAGLQPVTLGAKEGLALINGTQVMTGIAGLGVLRAERLAEAADVIGA